LETDKQQLDLIEKEYKYPNWKNEKKNIRYWIRQLSSNTPNLNDCVFSKKYRIFDLNYDFNSECNYDILIKQRNQIWLTILAELMKDKNCFVAVGYMHLRNKCGLIEQLKEKGFFVEPIELEPAGNRVDG
jgi:uncharacterized protein YbaP (TraB family)